MKQRTILKKKKLKRKSYKISLNIHMSGFGIRLFYFETGSENSSVSEGTQRRASRDELTVDAAVSGV